MTRVGSVVSICNSYVVINDLASNADNRIVGTAINIKEETGSNVIVMTNDGNMTNIVRAYGLRAQELFICLSFFV